MPETGRVRHTVVVSDVHLCEGVDTVDDPLWMRWRHRSMFPDADFAALVDRVLAAARPGDDAVELVLNGDLFDFDASPVANGAATFVDPPRTESVARRQIGRIMDDHRGYVAALGRLLAAGHRVVFVAGNHDPQVQFPAVQAVIRQRLADASGDPVRGARVLFRSWFHQTPDGIHVEHGNQYDPLCSFRYPMLPGREGGGPGHDETEIQPTVGSLAFRHLISRMGYFNPHVDATWMLDLAGYVTHWARHYCFSDRALATAWASGAVRALMELARRRDAGDPARAAANITLAAQETGAPVAAVARHAALYAPPAEDELLRVAREFWLDRAALAGLCAVASVMSLWAPRRVALPLALAIPALAAAYELATPKPALADTYAHIASVGAQIAGIYGARAVLFGHTHVPYGRWKDGVFYGNSGTWSAAFEDDACGVPVDPRGRPVLWLHGNDQVLSGGLYRWRADRLAPEPDNDAQTHDSATVPTLAGAA